MHHGKAHVPEPLVAAVLDQLALRVPMATVEARLPAFRERVAKGVVRIAAACALGFALLGGPLIWLGSGWRLALAVVGGLFLLVPLAYLVSDRDADRIAARWRDLPWDRSVSFEAEGRGLVLLGEDCLAMECPHAIWTRGVLKGLRYDPEGHALEAAIRDMGGGRTIRERLIYRRLPLPRKVPRGQAEAIADLFHLLWTHEERTPSAAAKAWLQEHMHQ